MDSTTLYREIVTITLGGVDTKPIIEKPIPDAVTAAVDEIASQLSKIQASIRAIRPRYLALSGSQQMLESDKDDFDQTVRRLIEREKRRVDILEQQERQRQEKQNSIGLTAKLFSDPNAEGISETLAGHRRGMFFYLSFQLEAVSSTLGELQRVRYARSVNQNIKKAKPMAKSKQQTPPIPGSFDSISSVPGRELDQQQLAALPDESTLDDEDTYNEPVSEGQMRLIQEEHDELVDNLNASLKEAEKAEQSLREIAALQSELSQHLSNQSLQLESLNSDALRTTNEITGANKYLENAKRSNRFASRCVIATSLTVGVLLLLANGK